MSVRIIAIRDEPIEKWRDGLVLPAGQVGEIVVQGFVVTGAYFGRDDATALAKIADPAATHLSPQQRLWHRMGDVGYFDEQGRLWFCGRKSQRVKSAGGDRFTICCEGIFNTHPQVRRTALVGIADNGAAPRRTDFKSVPLGDARPVLCVELSPDATHADEATIRRELQAIGARHVHTHDIHDILFHPHFPVDVRHNAKINREELAHWASQQLKTR
jgi:acyl-CoA synthetase (AMP-forming)/AMP-acid ligase II